MILAIMSAGRYYKRCCHIHLIAPVDFGLLKFGPARSMTKEKSVQARNAEARRDGAWYVSTVSS